MEEKIITPDEEVKDITPDEEEKVITPEDKTEEVVEPEKKFDTVPLPVYLELKEDLKNLKQELKKTGTSEKVKVEVQGVSDLTSKYPDVDKEFISDLLNSATINATKKVEEKYNPILAKQEEARQQIAFDKAFDELFDKTIKENEGLPNNIDKKLIKTISTSEEYKNTPLSEILIKIYGISGKASSENDTRTSAEIVKDIVTFDNITPEQKTAIMADEGVRQKYFDWLDKQV